mmetsp:Transcript_124558/g.387853  ORF Transcript_124558/g.387853 Transcript_124558/m.387853 type:complete len:107 (+) Transcript_124558:67-387(+)
MSHLAASGFPREPPPVDSLAESGCPGGTLDGDAKLTVAGQAEAVNRRRGEFPEYERVSAMSKAKMAATMHKLTSGTTDGLPTYADALRERKESAVCPPYKTPTGRP